MLTISSDNLGELVGSALQRMAFVFCDPADSTGGEVLAVAKSHAWIELRGNPSYVVTVSATPGFIQEVASGMMGCEPEDIDVDEHGRATVAELANIFGGELVMQLASQDDGMMIGLPRELDDEEMSICMEAAATAGQSTILETELGQLMVCFLSN
tara:strand:+ start:6387 stop:6851 length:465 start_codon:yes stop_codon:yes gene_type:complete